VEVEIENKKRNFVRAMRPLFSPFLGSNFFPFQSAEELSSMVLVKMRETAEQYLNKKVKSVRNFFNPPSPL
jgi:Icc-related predicted phosphoesterase